MSRMFILPSVLATLFAASVGSKVYPRDLVPAAASQLPEPDSISNTLGHIHLLFDPRPLSQVRSRYPAQILTQLLNPMDNLCRLLWSNNSPTVHRSKSRGTTQWLNHDNHYIDARYLPYRPPPSLPTVSSTQIPKRHRY